MFIEWMHRGRLARELVGGKGASLSDLMYGGFAVPPGFCVTADGYRYFAESTGLDTAIDEVLAGIDAGDTSAVHAAEGQIAALVTRAELPGELRDQIAEAYDELTAMHGVACAVRSSAVSEDGAGASFAGLYESFLNVRGVTDVLDRVRRCYASLWSRRAVVYKAARETGATDDAMAVVVMGLVPSDSSGIAFTAHPVTGDRDLVVINSSWGLGEAIVSGRVTPDSFVVQKQSLALVEREIYPKELATYPHPDGEGTIDRPLTGETSRAPSLTDDQAREVARVVSLVEQHYGSPQDVEWGMAGGQLFLLQSRPITTL